MLIIVLVHGSQINSCIVSGFISEIVDRSRADFDGFAKA